MENINVQVYSLISEPISPIEKLKTIAKLGFAGAEFTADFTEVPVEEMKKVLAENNLKVDSAHVGLDQIEGVLPYFAELGAKLVICPATNFCNKAEAEEVCLKPLVFCQHKSDVLVYGSIDVKIHAAACLVERYADQSIRVDYLVHILVVFAKIIISFIKMA